MLVVSTFAHRKGRQTSSHRVTHMMEWYDVFKMVIDCAYIQRIEKVNIFMLRFDRNVSNYVNPSVKIEILL